MPKSDDIKVPKLGLAPMHGITDFPFRLWFYLISSCRSMTTPFLRVTETYPHKIPTTLAPDVFDPKVKEKLNFKTTLQMMASCPKRFSEAYFMFEDFLSEVELNCGCPSPKVVNHAAGSSLLREVSIFKDFVSSIASDIGSSNFSVKMRTGYSNSDDFTSLIESIKDLGLKKLTIHGRTKEQKYSSFSRKDLIHEASLLCPFPIIGSGDIVDKESYFLALKDMPEVSAFIVGRGALKNPFLFQEIENKNFVLGTDLSFFFYALTSYGLLMELSKSSPEKLRVLILEGCFDEPLFSDKNRWKEVFQKLYETFYGEIYSKTSQIVLSGTTLGRVKLVWGNLLQGTLLNFQGRNLLRAKSSEDFFQKLLDLFSTSCSRSSF